jgi:hypothetical protein
MHRYRDLSAKLIHDLYACDLIIEYFVVFSRFDYALLRAGYVRTNVAHVAADWDRFGKEYDRLFQQLLTPETQSACSYLLNHPPKKQVREDGALIWKAALPDEHEPLLYRLLVYVRRIRNNLFHGIR